MFILIYFKKQLENSFLDRVLRRTINFFAPYFYKFSKKNKSLENIKFVFICYGGLGDCILTFPFLVELSLKYPVTIFLDSRFKGLTFLLPKNIVTRIYVKDQLINELKLFSASESDYILIQQSPIMEFILFHHFLKRPSTVGFIYNQSLISFEGINFEAKEILSINKIDKYKHLLRIICSIEHKNKTLIKFNYLNDKIDNLKYKDSPPQKYFILSPTKNHNWEMGFLDFQVYARFIINMSKRVNLIPVIVGTKDDKLIINKILEYIPKKIKIHNLIGKTNVIDLIPLLKNAEFVVANDNGIHHFSNFLNIKTLTLYNFSSYEVYNWSNKNSQYIFNPVFRCMPCIGMENGPFDNYPFKCPWQVRCKKTISDIDIVNKLVKLRWIS